MTDLGHDMILRPPSGTRVGGGTSDLLVDGVPYDLYTPTTGNPSRIISVIAKCNICYKIWIFWTGFNDEPTEYAPCMN